ncbi:MAG: HlyD family type I secretion periplasmic adaptor subunit, partial [Alphaproteobacteria bacterium]|nr:HlyD family type I secretion periplasmic adaptor subunit [Alphaproteobacteria bacterium]
MAGKIKKKLDFSEFDLRKFDLTRKYDDDFSPADGILWRDHMLLYAMALFIFSFIVWAGFSSLSEVVHGRGEVIPAGSVQVIQSLEGGIISDMLVREGDTVKASQPLLRLSDVQARADLEANSRKYYGMLATVVRLEAEAGGQPLKFPDDVVKGAPESVTAETGAYAEGEKQLQSRLDVLRQQLAQRKQKLIGLKQKISDGDAVLKLAEARRKMVAPMVARGSAAKEELLQIDSDIAQKRADLDALKQSLPLTAAEVKEAEGRIIEQDSTFRADAQRQLSKMMVDLNALKATLAALRDKSRRTEIRSPVYGTVMNIRIRTVGGVVKPGEPIMEVVPLKGQLVVETLVRPADIAFIHTGQKAVVRLTAYDFSVYGALQGRVVEVSPDSTTNEKGESFYHVRIRTDQSSLKKDGKSFPIIPGMQATVDIVTGKRTVM